MDPEMISNCKQKFFTVILVNMLNYRHDGILQTKIKIPKIYVGPGTSVKMRKLRQTIQCFHQPYLVRCSICILDRPKQIFATPKEKAMMYLTPTVHVLLQMIQSNSIIIFGRIQSRTTRFENYKVY